MSDWPFQPGESPFRIKGIVYRQLHKTVERDVPGGWDGLLEAIDSPALRRFASQPFLAASWYDNEPIVELNDLSARLTEQDPQAYLVERAREQAEEDLSGVYSWLLKLASPLLVGHGFKRLIPRYFEWGETNIRTVDPHQIETVRSGIPTRLVDWCDAVSQPFLEYAFEESGARDVRVTLEASRPDGSAHGVPTKELSYSIRWR